MAGSIRSLTVLPVAAPAALTASTGTGRVQARCLPGTSGPCSRLRPAVSPKPSLRSMAASARAKPASPAALRGPASAARSTALRSPAADPARLAAAIVRPAVRPPGPGSSGAPAVSSCTGSRPGCSPACSGSVSDNRTCMRAAPSAMAWWVRSSNALPSPYPSSRCNSHSGRSLRSGCPARSLAARCNARWSPGVGSRVRLTWSASAKPASSTHSGAAHGASVSAGSATRCRNRRNRETTRSWNTCRTDA